MPIFLGPNTSTDQRPIYGYKAGRLGATIAVGLNGWTGNYETLSRHTWNMEAVARLALARGWHQVEVSQYVWSKPGLVQTARHAVKQVPSISPETAILT